MVFVLPQLLAASAILLPAVAGQSTAERTLKAAALQGDILKRGNVVPIRERFRLDYLEDDALATEPLGAQIDIRGKKRSLLLEEIDHMLEEVHCEDGQIDLKIQSQHFSGFRESMESYPELMIITSHYGCSEAGARTPYRIIDKSFFDTESHASLKLGPASWENDYNLEIRIAREDSSKYRINQHDHLRRRQAESTAGSSASATGTVLAITSVEFPSPTATPDRQTANNDVDNSLIDTKIWPPPDVPLLVVDDLVQAPGIEITCRNCSFFGTLDFDTARLRLGDDDTENFDLVEDTQATFAQLGNIYVSMRADNLGAIMEFSAAWNPQLTVPLEIPLGPSIPLTPLGIIGIANLGITFIPKIVIGATISTEMNFDFGFSATVPSNSIAFIDFDDPSNSSISGLDQTEVNVLPVNTNVSTVASARLFAIFQPEILVGAVFPTTEAGVSVFANIPEIGATFAMVNGTDSKCERANGTASPTLQEEINQVEDLFGELLHIEPEVTIAAGFSFDAFGVAETAFTPLETTFPMPTSCLAFDEDSNRFEPAAEAFASATSEAANGGSGSDSMAAGSFDALRTNALGLLFGIAAGVLVMIV